MRRLAFPAAFLFLLALLLALSSCGDDGGGTDEGRLDPVAVTASPTSTAAATPPASATPPSTPLRTPVIYASPPPAPDDWATYSDPLGLYTLKYPPDWFQEDEGATYAAIYSFNPAKVPRRPGLPGEIVKVEVGHYQAAGSSGCGGSISFDWATNATIIEPGSAEWTLGGQPAWLFVYGPGEGEGGTTLIPGISLVYKGDCFLIAGYYTQTVPDVQTFLQIADSFQFTY